VTFEQPIFFALLALVAAFVVLSPPGWVRVRAACLVVAGLVALRYWVGLPPLLLGLLAAAILWIHLGLGLTRKVAERAPVLASFLVFAPVLALWVLGKQSVAIGYPPLAILYFVGFSFFLVKAWTLIKDVHDGVLPRPDPLVLGAYFLFFPTWISGPMHSIAEFEKSLATPLPLDAETVVSSVFRVLYGLVKVQLVAALLSPLSLQAVAGGAAVGPVKLVLCSFVYSIVIWADFSGYSDVAIATARLAGFATPENFARPYAAANIREFWQRWHISFSRVLTNYLFVPVSRALGRKLGARRRLVMVVAYLVTFLACGYWHGPTTNFLLWGLYHGVGLIAYDLARGGRRKGKPTRLGHALAVAVTFSFVSLGWIPFVLPLSRLLALR
jgi:D-alanyl-lipoteichoic acid acyltransferase DltB (MBOAT superfamily)